MADNVSFQSSTLATPAAGVTVATDDVGGAQFQRIKLDIGGDGLSSPVTVLNPFPIGTLAGGTVIVTGTIQALGSIQGVGTFHVLGTVQSHGTTQILGTVQAMGSLPLVGTGQFLGTFQPLAGSVHLASNLPGGSINAQGVVAHDSPAAGNPLLVAAFGSSGTQAAVGDGDVTRLWTDLNGRLQIRGTIDSLPVISGTVQTHGTSQVLGTTQPLAGSVHVANVLSGTFQAHGTAQVLGSVQGVGTFQVLGSVQTVGTSQALGTVQPLAGSVHLATNLAGGTVVAVGSAIHGAVADARPLLMAAFGSSGTQAAVDDGDVTRLWADLNGRLIVRGTIDSIPNITITGGTVGAAGGTFTVVGTVQTHGTSQVLGSVQGVGTFQVLGSVQAVGTNQALGTVQPLAGSVHLATNLAGGTVVAVGSAIHGAAADTRPLLISAFGSSGTQSAVDDGDAVRLWADVNGRLQVRGTVDSLVGTVQTHGTSQVLGSVQGVGTFQVLGSVQTVGTSQALGTVQPLAGSAHIANTPLVQGPTAYTSGGGSANPVLVGGVGVRTRPGTVSEGSVTRAWFDQQGRQVIQVGAGTIEPLGTLFGGAGANGTMRAGAAGSYMRIHDIVVSGSAAGTFRLLEDTTTRVGPLFLAANGGWNFNSATGLKLTTAGASLVAAWSAGSWSVMINYSFEGM